MPEKYRMQQGADSLWEVIDAATGEVVKLGGLLLSGLDEHAAKGALSVLLPEIVRPNGTPNISSGESDDTA